MGELLSGFRGGTKESTNRKELEQFLDSPRVNLLTLDEETAEHYAKIYREVKKKGKPIPTNDLWVAASAMRHALAIFSYDEHFQISLGLFYIKSYNKGDKYDHHDN